MYREKLRRARPQGVRHFVEDAQGHEHRGKGPDGGQFVSKGQGGGASGAGASEHHTAALHHFGKSLAEAPGLTHEQKQHYHAAAKAVVGKMTPKAAARLKQNVTAWRFHPDTRALTAYLAQGNARVKELMAQGKVVGGAYSPGLGVLHLDGQNILEGKPMATAGVYAHEMGHAIDGRTGERISERPDWQAAWEAELREGRISQYAGTTPQEGFAEFSRLVRGTKLTAEQIARHFPKCSAIWRKEGLL